MPLTLPAALDAAIKFDVYQPAHLLEITRQDGFVVRVTDAATDINDGTNTYRADIGFTASAMLIGVNLNQTQGLTLSLGLWPEGITKADLAARRYDSAAVLYYECDFTDPVNTKLLLFKGKVGESQVTDVSKAQIEVLPFTNDEVQFAAEVYSQTCGASLGDKVCRFPIESRRVDFTVVQVVNRSTFIIDKVGPDALGRPDIDTYAEGQLKWLTGGNAQWECDVLNSTTSTKRLTLFFPTPVPVQVGDTGKLYPGCDRQLSTCLSKFANVLNFDGEPFAPQWG